MNNKLWNEFLDGKAVINCKTENEARQFIKFCKNNGFKQWASNVSLNILRWDKSDTCYRNDGGQINLGYVETYKDKMWKIEKIATFEELMGKTFTGPELAQEILDGKFKEGTKFKDEGGNKYYIYICDPPTEYGLKCDYTSFDYATSGALINRTFTLIEEPKPEFFYFNQVKSSGKRIKLKGWDKFYTLQEVLKILGDYPLKVINEAFNKKVWEVEA